jgi:ABC-type amino acid transport substrate-binding protein
MFMSWIRSYNRNRTCSIAAIFVFLVILMPFGGFAMNTDSRDTLVLLGNEDLAPIVYNDNGTAKGVAVDIAKAIGERIGYEVQVVTADWGQAQQMVLNGEADGLLHINPSNERNELYDFSFPLLKSDFSMFFQIDNVSLKSEQELKSWE